MAFGDLTEEVIQDTSEERKRSRQLTAAELNAFWSAPNFLSKTQLPFPDASEPHRLALAERFRNDRRHRVTVTSKHPPPMTAFVLDEVEPGVQVDAVSVNSDASLCAGAFASKTVVWGFDAASSAHAVDDNGPSRIYQKLFQTHNKYRVELPTGRGILSLDFSPDSPLLLTGSLGGNISLWSLESSQKLVSFNGLTSRTAVWDARWCPAGAYFSSGSSDGYARIWRSDVPFPIRVLKTDSASTHCQIVRWHPSCQLVAAATDTEVVVHDIASPSSVFRFQCSKATALEFSPTGFLLAAANAEGITVWELNTGKAIFKWDTFTTIGGLTWSFPSTSMLGDGGLKSVTQNSGIGHPLLISVDEDGTARLWDRLFISRPSCSEFTQESKIRPLHVRMTQRNLLVVAGVSEKGFAYPCKQESGLNWGQLW
jgi:WD40 repeat protein